jgi:hypothetical protein
MQEPRFDEAAFAAAFDQAHEDAMAHSQDATADSATQEEASEAQELIDEVDVAKFEAAIEAGAVHILKEDGHDLDMQEMLPETYVEQRALSHEEEKQEEQRQQHDDDALAATAEELLEKVKHNQSDKFRNSQFLGLMRKLRDREVRVEGDKMVETVSSASSSELASTPQTPIHIPHIPHACKVSGCSHNDHAWDDWNSPYI